MKYSELAFKISPFILYMVVFLSYSTFFKLLFLKNFHSSGKLFGRACIIYVTSLSSWHMHVRMVLVSELYTWFLILVYLFLFINICMPHISNGIKFSLASYIYMIYYVYFLNNVHTCFYSTNDFMLSLCSFLISIIISKTYALILCLFQRKRNSLIYIEIYVHVETSLSTI